MRKFFVLIISSLIFNNLLFSLDTLPILEKDLVWVNREKENKSETYFQFVKNKQGGFNGLFYYGFGGAYFQNVTITCDNNSFCYVFNKKRELICSFRFISFDKIIFTKPPLVEGDSPNGKSIYFTRPNSIFNRTDLSFIPDFPPPPSGSYPL